MVLQVDYIVIRVPTCLHHHAYTCVFMRTVAHLRAYTDTPTFTGVYAFSPDIFTDVPWRTCEGAHGHTYNDMHSFIHSFACVRSLTSV